MQGVCSRVRHQLHQLMPVMSKEHQTLSAFSASVGIERMGEQTHFQKRSPYSASKISHGCRACLQLANSRGRTQVLVLT